LTSPARADFAEIGGAKFYYETCGRGRPLVLVHAGIADRRMWDGQVEAFSRHFRVIRYDRRGFGQTAMVAGPFSHHEDLYRLLNFLGVGRCCLLGASQGAKTVVDFTLEHPEMAEALVMVAPAVGGFSFNGEQPRQFDELEEADGRGDVARVNELELQIWVDGPRRTPEQVEPGVRELVREMNLIALTTPPDLGVEQGLEPAASGRLGEVRAPVLVIAGELDTPRTLAAADLLESSIPGARKVFIEGAAHLPNMERPSEFNRHVLEFFGQLRRA
jgi:pimeloyl-ACP methyl ester carboxylesterase